MRVALFGASGKVGAVLAPRLRDAGHEVTPVERGQEPGLAGHDAAVDFTRPDAVRANVERALGAGVPALVGTTGLTQEDTTALDALARERAIACVVVPNFALGAVLMMRFAAEAVRSSTGPGGVADSRAHPPSGGAVAPDERYRGHPRGCVADRAGSVPDRPQGRAR